MAAAEPVKNPQRLASLTGQPKSSASTTHQKRSAKAGQTLPAPQRGMPLRPQDTANTVVSRTVRNPSLEIGKIGDTDRRTAQRLKRGKLDVDARLDLHGCTLLQAHDRLLEFLRVSQFTGARCVLVVTGKGRRKSVSKRSNNHAFDQAAETQPGKLRMSVPMWLNEAPFRPLVLSVSYAVQKDGGEGALYVLLRKKSGDARTGTPYAP